MSRRHSGSNEECFTLWVGNLHPKVTEDLLWELFLQGGPLESVSLPKQLNEGDNPTERQHKGFAFIRFVHSESVPYCEQIFASTELFGQQLKVRASHGRDSGPQRRGSFGGDYAVNLGATRRYSTPVFQQNFSSPAQFTVPFQPFNLFNQFVGPSPPWPSPNLQSVASPINPGFAGRGIYSAQTPSHIRQSLPVSSASANRDYHTDTWREGERREGERRSERYGSFGHYGDDASGRSHPRSTEKSYNRDGSYDLRDQQGRDRYEERRHLFEPDRDRDHDHRSRDRDRHGYEGSRYADRNGSSYRPRYIDDGYDRSRQEDLRTSLDRIYSDDHRRSDCLDNLFYPVFQDT